MIGGTGSDKVKVESSLRFELWAIHKCISALPSHQSEPNQLVRCVLFMLF